MKLIHGSRYNVLMRVDTEEGAQKFKDIQGISWKEYIYEQTVFTITKIYPSDHKFVVFTDEDVDDCEIYHVLSLDPNEHLMVYSDGRRADDGHCFTSEPRAFIHLIRDSEVQAVLATGDSPFDLDPNETDNYDELMKAITKKVNALLVENGEEPTASINNMICVSQL